MITEFLSLGKLSSDVGSSNKPRKRRNFSSGRVFALLSISILLSATGVEPARAMETYTTGENYVLESCLQNKLPGIFFLQTKARGSTVWTNQGKGKAYDALKYENGCTTPFVLDVWWKPKQVGLFSLRLYNSSSGKSYKYRSVRVLGASNKPTLPQVQYVIMPNLIGMTASQARSQITFYGYKLGSWSLPQSTGYAPSIACRMDSNVIIVNQSPAPGARVVNDLSTRVNVWVDCG